MERAKRCQVDGGRMKHIEDIKVINKFLIFYESLSRDERFTFERVLGRVINALPKYGSDEE